MNGVPPAPSVGSGEVSVPGVSASLWQSLVLWHHSSDSCGLLSGASVSYHGIVYKIPVIED